MRSLNTWQDLQAVVGLAEQPDLEFKTSLDERNPKFEVEARKDIAALANTLGGHILVGASTDPTGTQCRGFPGIAETDATRLGQALESVAKKGCRPTPFVSAQLYAVEGSANNAVLVFRVEMSAIAPVGAWLQQKGGGKLVDEGWCFPYRVGTQTKYLTPDQFGVFESMSARRAAALLDAIPEAERQALELRWPGGPKVHFNLTPLLRVEVHKNIGVFEYGRFELPVPLDDVASVWRENKGWIVALRGEVRGAEGTRPRPYYWHSDSGPRT